MKIVFVKAYYEHGYTIDLYTEHFAYDVNELLESAIAPKFKTDNIQYGYSYDDVIAMRT